MIVPAMKVRRRTPLRNRIKHPIQLHYRKSTIRGTLEIRKCFPGPYVFLLLEVSPDYAQPITGQVTEVTWPVIGQAQPEHTPSKRHETGAGKVLAVYNWITSASNFVAAMSRMNIPSLTVCLYSCCKTSKIMHQTRGIWRSYHRNCYCGEYCSLINRHLGIRIQRHLLCKLHLPSGTWAYSSHFLDNTFKPFSSKTAPLYCPFSGHLIPLLSNM